jgi:hypothetical protein
MNFNVGRWSNIHIVLVCNHYLQCTNCSKHGAAVAGSSRSCSAYSHGRQAEAAVFLSLVPYSGMETRHTRIHPGRNSQRFSFNALGPPEFWVWSKPGCVFESGGLAAGQAGWCTLEKMGLCFFTHLPASERSPLDGPSIGVFATTYSTVETS